MLVTRDNTGSRAGSQFDQRYGLTYDRSTVLRAARSLLARFPEVQP
jgi:hypothetical protein